VTHFGSRLRSASRSPLGRNIGSLYAIHLASYVLPIVSFPYLTRVLGPERFGLYMFVIGIARYGFLVTDWGFNFSATREVTVRRANGEDIAGPASAVTVARLVLLAACAIGLAVATLTVDRFQSDAVLYWVAFGAVAGSALLPVWLYQALERLPFVTISLLAVRVVTTTLVFVFVNSGSDLAIALVLWSVPWPAAALVALASMRRQLGVRFRPTRPTQWWRTFLDGGPVFLTLAFAGVYTALNAVVLGLLTDNAQVGYFAASETLITAAVGMLVPAVQGLFPRAARAGAEGSEDALAHVRRVLPYLTLLGAGLCVATFGLAPLVPHVIGQEFDRSVAILQLMSPLPLIIAIATTLFTQLMLPLRMDRAYTKIVAGAVVANILLTAVLVPSFEAIGTAITVVLTELAILIAVLIYLRCQGIRLFRPRRAT
jgi:polysaccharide transporter, PST family